MAFICECGCHQAAHPKDGPCAVCRDCRAFSPLIDRGELLASINEQVRAKENAALKPEDEKVAIRREDLERLINAAREHFHDKAFQHHAHPATEKRDKDFIEKMGYVLKQPAIDKSLQADFLNELITLAQALVFDKPPSTEASFITSFKPDILADSQDERIVELTVSALGKQIGDGSPQRQARTKVVELIDRATDTGDVDLMFKALEKAKELLEDRLK